MDERGQIVFVRAITKWMKKDLAERGVEPYASEAGVILANESLKEWAESEPFKRLQDLARKMDFDDSTRNPRKRRIANPRDEAAMAKKRQEAVDRLGGEYEYNKCESRAFDKWTKTYDEYHNNYGWVYAYWKFHDKIKYKYESGQIDGIEYWESLAQWLRDDMRRMDRECREKADEEVDMDEIIRDLDDRTRNPRKRRIANPRSKEEDQKIEDAKQRYYNVRERWWAFGEKNLDSYYDFDIKAYRKLGGLELDGVEYYESLAQWMRDDMRRMDRLRADAEVDMDEIIRELDDKTRNPRQRPNPPGEDRKLGKPVPVQVLEARMYGKDEAYTKKLAKLREEEAEANAVWTKSLKLLAPGGTMEQMDEWFKFPGGEKYRDYSDEQLDAMEKQILWYYQKAEENNQGL